MKRIILCTALLPLSVFAMDTQKTSTLELHNKSGKTFTVYYSPADLLKSHLDVKPSQKVNLVIKEPSSDNPQKLIISPKRNTQIVQQRISVTNTKDPVIVQSMMNFRQGKIGITEPISYSSDSSSSSD